MLSRDYHIQAIIEAEQQRGRERHIDHLRALREDAAGDGLVSRALGRLAALRPANARQAIAYEAHELTEYVCRLTDGSMGRVAMRQAEGEWVAVCIAA